MTDTPVTLAADWQRLHQLDDQITERLNHGRMNAALKANGEARVLWRKLHQPEFAEARREHRVLLQEQGLA